MRPALKAHARRFDASRLCPNRDCDRSPMIECRAHRDGLDVVEIITYRCGHTSERVVSQVLTQRQLAAIERRHYGAG